MTELDLETIARALYESDCSVAYHGKGEPLPWERLASVDPDTHARLMRHAEVAVHTIRSGRDAEWESSLSKLAGSPGFERFYSFEGEPGAREVTFDYSTEHLAHMGSCGGATFAEAIGAIIAEFEFLGAGRPKP